MLSNKILYVCFRILTSPLEALFTLLIFILSKETDATPLQLALLASIKPLSSLIAYQLNRVIFENSARVKPFLIFLCLMGSLPCVFFPYISNCWYFIGAYGLFTIAVRASQPAWIETLNQKFPKEEIAKTVATGSACNFFMVTLVPFALSQFLDSSPQLWTFFFAGLAGINMINIAVLLQMPLTPKEIAPSIRNYWKEGFHILRSDRPFLKYQILFFLGGAGLVMLQPILPIYFKETLHLSYTQLTLAFSVCRGIAYMGSSPFFAKYAPRMSLYLLNAIVNFLSCLFVACVLASSGQTHWLYTAYLMYGAMLAGCEMSWNLSGPTFAKAKDSTIYSSLNLLCIGLRACICPFLGQFIFSHTNSFYSFILCGFICLLSLIYAFYLEKKETPSFSLEKS